MIEAEARVVAVEVDLAWVEASRSTSCGHCGSAGSCGGHLFAELFGNRPNRVPVDNPLGALVGQQVVVGIPEGLMLTGALRLYLWPLLGLFFGALLGQELARLAVAGSSELFAVLGGLFGFALTLWVLRRLGVSAVQRRPVILRTGTRAVEVGLPSPLDDSA